MRAVAAALIIAWPVAAQDLAFTPDATEACLATGGGETCIGLSAQACIDTPDGYTTVGMGYCYAQELDFWDARLNAVYRELRASERAIDDEMTELGIRALPRAPALRDMQRAWIEYRDAACAYEYSQWGGGTGGGPANAACLMHLTAEQALALEARLKDRQQ